MASAFISYSTQDQDIADQLHNAMTMIGIETFMASVSIKAGQNWTEKIFDNLRKAQWVFFLASKNSCRSAAVQQELGISLDREKEIIPILLDIAPEELPGWVGKHQAIDLSKGPEALRGTIELIAKKIKVDNFWGGLIAGALLAGLCVLIARK